MQLYQDLFYDDHITALCSGERFVVLMVEVELSLVKAQTQCGIIPVDKAAIIEHVWSDFQPDIEALAQAIPLTGNAAAPLVKQLTSAVGKEDPEAAKFVHLGATSQDIVDTATMLKVKLFVDWLESEMATAIKHLRALSLRYRHTPMIGRTLMQQARPVTFGLKTAYWLQSLQQVVNHFQSIKKQVLVIQLGGAVGSRNAFLTKAVQQSFATQTGLAYSPAWHTNRVPINIFASCLGILLGSLGKIAQDVIFMAQTEVGEVAEPAQQGRGTSSTMPHKRNPILSTAIMANTQRAPFLLASLLGAMPQAYERAAGNWHAEWETLDQLMGLAGGAIRHSNELLAGLEVNEARMRQNIELTQGFIFAETVALAMASVLGKTKSYELVKVACTQAQQSDKHLHEVLFAMDLPLSATELKSCFLAENAIGHSLEIINEIITE